MNTPAKTLRLLPVVFIAIASMVTIGCDGAEPVEGAEPRVDALEAPAEDDDGIAWIAEVTPVVAADDGVTPAADFASADVAAAPAGACADLDDEEGVTVVGDDAATCALVSIKCNPGWELFDDECGCGCMYAGPVSATDDFATADEVPSDEPDLDLTTMQGTVHAAATDELTIIRRTHGHDGWSPVDDLSPGNIIVEPECFGDHCEPDSLTSH